jgi:tetratricopeptide (TPR) repeat protein
MEALDVLPRAGFDVARDGVPAHPRVAAVEARDARRLRRRLAPLAFFAAALLAAAPTSVGSPAPEALAPLRAALDSGDLPRAVRLGEDAVAADPESSEARDLLGRAYGLTARDASLLQQMHLARKARACFARAVELDPANVAALSDLARYDMQAPGVLGGGKKKARELIERVLALEPERGHVLLGELALQERRPSDGEAEFRKAIAAAPGGDRGRRALSDLLVSQKRYGEARAVWIEARELEPTATPAYELGGIALVSGEELEDAARGLEAGLSKAPSADGPTSADLHERLADVYERLGRSREAAVELEAALTLEPGRADWRKRLQRLEK